MNRETLVFGTRAYAPLQRAIAEAAHVGLGEVERKQFPDGERYHRIVTPVADHDTILVGGTISDLDTLELYDLASGLVEAGAHTVTLVVPYFGCATMDRAVHAGEVVTAKTRARLLSSLPAAGSGNRIVLLDLHTDGIQHYFHGDTRAVNVYGRPIVAEAARTLGGPDFVLACTDAGRAKWVESLANQLGVPASFVFKRRLSGRETAVSAVSAQVQGKRVVIYDDMIRTGGSLLGAARAYRDAGAASVAAVCTHGVLPGDSLERIRGSGLIEHVVCTDSHPRAMELRSDYLTVLSCAELLYPHVVAL